MSIALQTGIRLRAMEPEEWSEVTDLIYVSLNYWCEANGRPAVFRGAPGSTRVFYEVYEALAPGRCSEEQAAALLLAELNLNAGRTPLFLLPVEYGGLVQQAYSWGARNCELHVAQVLGEAPPFRGVTIPTFLPETA